MFDAVQKRTNGVVHGLPGKVLYLGQTTAQTWFSGKIFFLFGECKI